MNKTIKNITFAVILMSLSGCGRMLSYSHPFYTSGMYRGTRTDANLVGMGGEGLFFVIDLPFSAVVDTVMLPYDYHEKKKSDEEYYNNLEDPK